MSPAAQIDTATLVVVLLGGDAGLRAGEMRALEWTDLDFVKRFITPAMSEQLKIPNACTGCHTDRSNEWASEALRGWTGVSPWLTGQ